MMRKCCVCHKVEQGGEWRTRFPLVDDNLMTHGYCPQCFVVALAEIEDFLGDKAIYAPGSAGWSPRPAGWGPCV